MQERRTHSPSALEQTKAHMRLLVLIVLTLFSLSVSKNSGQIDRITKQKRERCENENCSHLYALENTNCVNECLSPDCFKSTYEGKELLEDGEINNPLEKTFRICVRREVSSRKKGNRGAK